MSELPAEVLDLLVCPSCHTKLALDYEARELVCTGAECGLAYPIRDGIPILLVDEARRPGNPSN
ncbi:MAG TPA: Trm112 family protein [Propionicimonas sp.]|nr:Trm112 family protein [Propionicimonas sp.]HQA77125.1 Trm112 family protein [Propionicimonas sp.]HQD96330.1 Trm112 family protein [Propionicimonas sp.]